LTRAKSRISSSVMVRESAAFDPIAGSGTKLLVSRLIFFIPSLVSYKPIIRVYYHPHTFVLWLPPLPGTLFLLTIDRQHLYACRCNRKLASICIIHLYG